MNKTAMNKTEMVEELSQRTDIRASDVTRVVNALLGLVTEELVAGREVSLSGICVLKPVRRPARTAHNPRTLELVNIPERTRVTLRPSRTLRKALGEQLRDRD
jgi:DNA-binding protein HU-beta